MSGEIPGNREDELSSRIARNLDVLEDKSTIRDPDTGEEYYVAIEPAGAELSTVTIAKQTEPGKRARPDDILYHAVATNSEDEVLSIEQGYILRAGSLERVMDLFMEAGDMNE